MKSARKQRLVSSILVNGTPADSSTSIVAGNAADRITVSGTGQAGGLTLQAAGGADQVSLAGLGAGSLIDMFTGAAVAPVTAAGECRFVLPGHGGGSYLVR